MILAIIRPLRVVFFRSGSGHEPVREWLKGLAKDERKAIGRDIKKVQYRWPLGLPLVRHLGDGICEVRSGLSQRAARTLLFVHGQEIILLHAFFKKTRRTPPEALALAKRRQRTYLLANE